MIAVSGKEHSTQDQAAAATSFAPPLPAGDILRHVTSSVVPNTYCVLLSIMSIAGIV
jgi:enhancing lycopene biosynthesis protein 2